MRTSPDAAWAGLGDAPRSSAQKSAATMTLFTPMLVLLCLPRSTTVVETTREREDLAETIAAGLRAALGAAGVCSARRSERYIVAGGFAA
jgi:hypothetical protein